MNTNFSLLAQRKLALLNIHLTIVWSESSWEKFKSILDEKLIQIERRPNSCKNFINHHFRMCVVTKQTSFIYTIVEEEIIIITIFDNRQNPALIYKDLIDYFS